MADTENLYNLNPGVKPDVNQPVDPYKRINVNPGAFEGPGRALEGLGQTISHVGDVWGEVQADDATNNFFDSATQTRDNFLNLRGQDALNGQQDANKQLNEQWTQQRSSLFGPARLKFDNETRRIRSTRVSEMATHASDQGKAFATNVNQATQQNALTGVANGAGDDNNVEYWRGKATDAAIKNLGIAGMDTPEQRTAAIDVVNRAVAKTRVEALEPDSPAQAMAMATKYKTDLGPEYQPIHDRLQGRAYKDQADQGYNQIAAESANAVKTRYASGGGGARPAAFQGDDPSMGALRHFEGFRSEPYYDVNHWRVGYGSDTITKPDGTVEPVGQNTKVTPDDAERDLQRRTRDTQNKIVLQVGPQAWGGLNPTQQAALTSMAYNYGALPYDVQFAVRGGGGSQAIASAMLGHRGDNGGVNAARRQQEAQAMTGGQMPTGLPFGGSGQPQQAASPSAPPRGGAAPILPGAPTATQASANSDDLATVQPAAAEVQQPPTEPQSQASAAEDLNAEVVRRIGESDAPTEVKQEMFRLAEQNYRMAQIASEQDAKAEKAKKEGAYNHIYDIFNHGDYTGALSAAQKERAAGSITAPELATITEGIQRRSQDSDDPVTFGKSFGDVTQRIARPSGSDGRIDSVLDIMNIANAGELTPKGEDRAIRMLKDRQEEERGKGAWDKTLVHASISSVAQGLKRKMSFDGEGAVPGFEGLKDPAGEEAYNTKFLPRFYSEIDAIENDPKKNQQDVWNYLADGKHLDELVKWARTPQDMERSKLLSAGQVADAGGTDPRAIPPPEGIQQDAWVNVVGAPAMVFGQDGKPTRISTDNWAQFVGRLAANPRPGAIAAFDKKFPGHDGASILQMLGVQQQGDGAPGAAQPAQPTTQAPVPNALVPSMTASPMLLTP